MGKKLSKIPNHQIKELEKSTYFERSELEAWYENFMHDCPKGILTRDEFQRIYQQFFPHGNPHKFSEIIFDVFDANKDGKLNFREFITAVSVCSRGSVDEKLNWAFDLYDLDKDGYITKSEMKNIIISIYDMVGNLIEGKDQDENNPDNRVEKIFKTMDKNDDGKLSREEFLEGSKYDPWILQALSLDLLKHDST